MVGWAPNESATEVAKKYLDSIEIKDYEVAYNLLSKDSKESVSLEKFEEYQDTLFKLQTLKDYKLGEENKVEKYKYSNKEYTNLVKIKETDTIKYITENKVQNFKLLKFLKIMNINYYGIKTLKELLALIMSKSLGQKQKKMKIRIIIKLLLISKKL